ncbi:Csu type fimbrial protein [Kordiimonas marina]|uniref:Csu type fimbrial protein n=1 Tax=Kordiimonas marina TaxID=2872312 RepID=UPI001FF3A8B0|nr:spore coat U domain-containing protein [Kordiimonas marina]MCJ9430624.1 spore coat U domain-containing protein [Kordiimonas marina]
MMIKRLVPAVLLISLTVSPAIAQGGHGHGGPPSCTGCYCSVSATNVNFGTYDTLLKPTLYSTGSISVTCGTDTIGDVMSYDIELSWGKSGSLPREMESGTNVLTYNLYTDASHASVWGDGKKFGSSVVSDSYTFTSLCCEVRNYTDYGRLDGGQNAVPGVYVDDIVVTVSW